MILWPETRSHQAHLSCNDLQKKFKILVWKKKCFFKDDGRYIEAEALLKKL